MLTFDALMVTNAKNIEVDEGTTINLPCQVDKLPGTHEMYSKLI